MSSTTLVCPFFSLNIHTLTAYCSISFSKRKYSTLVFLCVFICCWLQVIISFDRVKFLPWLLFLITNTEFCWSYCSLYVQCSTVNQNKRNAHISKMAYTLHTLNAYMYICIQVYSVQTNVSSYQVNTIYWNIKGIVLNTKLLLTTLYMWL